MDILKTSKIDFLPPSKIEKTNKVKDKSFQDKLENAAKKKDLQGLKEASQEFEAYFINIMLKQMRKTVIDSGLIEKSEARKTFEGMLDQEYASTISKKDGIGLGKAIYDAMRKAYE